MSFFDSPALPIIVCAGIALLLILAFRSIGSVVDARTTSALRQFDRAQAHADYVRISAERLATQLRAEEAAARTERIQQKHAVLADLDRQLELARREFRPAPPSTTVVTVFRSPQFSASGHDLSTTAPALQPYLPSSPRPTLQYTEDDL